ncbi:MAG: sensor histidine kinase, partial [Gaiellales bacterium]
AAAIDAPIWVYSGARAIESPRVAPAVDAAAASLAGGPSRVLDVPSARTRLYAVPVIAHGKRLGTVVAGLSLAPYSDTRRAALVGSIALALALLVVVAAATRWILGRALRPVAEMTRSAAVWSEHDLDRRFALGPPHDELGALAATLDSLLERIADALRREQRLTAEISHELRTPLARIRAEAELALRRERDGPGYRDALAAIQRNAAQLTRTVETLLEAARTEASARRATSDARATALEAAAACQELVRERSLDLQVSTRSPSPMRVRVDHALAVQILQPVIENACRYGEHVVTVELSAVDTCVVYTIRDDGSGLTLDEAGAIFEPGRRGRAAELNGQLPGAGLGLALARRLARGAAGEIEAHPGDGGCFSVRLPCG